MARSAETEADSLDPDAYPPVAPFLDILEPSPGQVLADVGVGRLALTLAVAEAVGPEGTVHAIARDPETLLKVRQVAGERGLTQLDAVQQVDRGLPVDAASLDAAWSIDLFHRLDSPSSQLEDMQRLLKPGGRFVVADWRSTRTPGGPPLRQRVTLVTLFKLLRQAGFDTLRNHDVLEHHHVVEVVN